MNEVDIETLIHLFKESVGVEAAEKIIHEAIREANFPIKTSYSQEEFSKICDALKKRGGFIKTIATIASTTAYSTFYYEEELAKEKKEKDDLARLSTILEQKVEERTKELKEAQAQLVQSAKMAAVGNLGAGVAHELNNPLGGILGYAQFILEKFQNPDFGIEDFKSCQRYIGSMEREAVRCKKIVENLLKFSRRPISAKPEPIDLIHAIEETLSITGHQLKLKNIKVTTDYKPELAKVMGIVNHLQQVFTNIILNAQQAMPEGGELKITAENIIDENTQLPTGAKIEFADSGCGIPEENLQRIFEPFFTTKAKEKGVDLGLSLSYQIIQDHKGTMEVKSQVSKGSVFIITLPVAK